MNGKRYDEQYEIGCPELSNDWDFGAIQVMMGPDGGLVLAEGADAGEAMKRSTATMGTRRMAPRMARCTRPNRRSARSAWC